MKKCDIIIPVWNELESTEECIARLKKYTHSPYRLIVIDNGSEDKTFKYLKSLKNDFRDYLLIRNEENLGFVKAVNQGIKNIQNPYVCLLNNDAYVTDNWFTELMEGAESGPKNIGIANPSSNVFGVTSSDGERYELEELDYCKGFCMLIKSEVIEKIGFFDEIYGMGYFEEKDFSRKAKDLGYISIRVKSSFVYHRDKVSFDKISNRDSIFENNEKIYNKRWGNPINIAFIIKSGRDLESWRKLAIYKFLDKGHVVHVFYSQGKPELSLKDHINIKYHCIFQPFFRYATFLKILGRLKKKKISIIIARGKTFDFFKRLKQFHKADVFIDDEKIVNFI